MTDESYTTFPHSPDMVLWVTVKSKSGKTYYIVSDKFRREYYLWRDKKPTKYKSADPTCLNKYIK